MKERYSEGKSGSFFYFTPDGKYLVKTLTVGEVRTLIEMLPRLHTPCVELQKYLPL
eukprot:TRINITY_DN3025_c0_g1_i1.p1 TRINITY_DN3025_c0_g1~~TRINITY_DN3025_c0_g1_i1.p1  ORF type:complete len:56 (-),score=13.87 TRINITY_DN3025_c0_g1_i1:269-436(-)